MNYRGMTDFEINKAVAVALGGVETTDYKGLAIYDMGESQPLVVSQCMHSKGDFLPCNSWADAGPIIEKENISLTCHQSRDEWAAIFNRHCMAANNNPLRAAMECFLMKKERENAA